MISERLQVGERLSRKLPFKLLAGVAGLFALAGCSDGYVDAYDPTTKDYCSVVRSPMLQPEYEADRWADEPEARAELAEDISDLIVQGNQTSSYAVCVDPDGLAHIANSNQIQYMERFYSRVDQGVDVAGLSIPAIVPIEDFTFKYQTVIDPGHGF